MRFEIEEEHFTVFNLLLLLLVWANTCYLLVIFLRPILPTLVATILILSGLVLTVAMVIITLYTSIRWIKHHNLGWWLLIALIALFIISYSLDSTIKNIFIREQLFNEQQSR